MMSESAIEKCMVELTIKAENRFYVKKKINKEWKYVSQYEKLKLKNKWREQTESDLEDDIEYEDGYQSFYTK